MDDGIEMQLQICATEPNDFIDIDKNTIDGDQDLLIIPDDVLNKAATPKRHERSSFHQR